MIDCSRGPFKQLNKLVGCRGRWPNRNPVIPDTHGTVSGSQCPTVYPLPKSHLRTTLCQVDFITQYCQKNEIILYFLLWFSIISLDLLPSTFTNLLERCQTWVIGISHYRRKMVQRPNWCRGHNPGMFTIRSCLNNVAAVEQESGETREAAGMF